jgi:hypothetical protein
MPHLMMQGGRGTGRIPHVRADERRLALTGVYDLRLFGVSLEASFRSLSHAVSSG